MLLGKSQELCKCHFYIEVSDQRMLLMAWLNLSCGAVVQIRLQGMKGPTLNQEGMAGLENENNIFILNKIHFRKTHKPTRNTTITNVMIRNFQTS